MSRPTEARNDGCYMLTMAEYLASDGVSKHGLDWFAKSPEHYRDYRAGILAEEQTDAMKFGSLLHALVFEDRRDFVVFPVTYPSGNEMKPWHGGANYCKAWETEQTLPVVSQHEALLLGRWSEAILKHPLAAPLLKEGKPEVSMFATDPDTGLLLKCRSDWQRPKGIVDLKTTTNAATWAFSREIHQRRYHVQAAMNCHVAGLLGLDMPDFYFIALEKGEVPRINVRLLSQKAIGLGLVELNSSLVELAECLETNRWPGYCGDEIETIELPPYAGDASPLELQIGGQSVTM